MDIIQHTIDNKKIRLHFLLALLIATGVLTFFVFRPFLYTLILAIVFALVFQPVHKRILQWFGQWHSMAAFTTTIVIIIVIVAPLIFLERQIFHEFQQLYTHTSPDLSKVFPAISDFSVTVDHYAKEVFAWLTQNTIVVFSNITKLLVSFFIFIVSLYYLLRDGHKLKKMLTSYIPLTATDDELIFKKLETAINSVVKGSLIIAIIQGILAGFGFLFFGVPNFILWGTVAAIAALIPGVGTAIVIIPNILFLYFTGNTLAAFGLLIWGVLVVGLIDNLLRPIFIGQGIKIHPLLIFFSVFGGLIFFGPIGFLLGPLTISLLFALLDIYFSTHRQTI